MGSAHGQRGRWRCLLLRVAVQPLALVAVQPPQEARRRQALDEALHAAGAEMDRSAIT